MKLFQLSKDGGPESRVWGYFLVEIKKLFSVVVLHFKDGSREAYHNHAFDAISWILKGHLTEEVLQGGIIEYRSSIIPIFTSRDRFHKVTSHKDTFVISFRGPWRKWWKEYIRATNQVITLTHGRKVLSYG